MTYKCFTGKNEDLNTFLDQLNNAYVLCDPKFYPALLINAIEGEPWEELQEHPEVTNYQDLQKFLKKNYKTKESFAQCYHKLSIAH